MIESASDVRVQDPSPLGVAAESQEQVGDGVMGTASRPEAVAHRFEAGFPAWLQGSFDDTLANPVLDGRYPQGPLFSVGLGDIHSAHRVYAMRSSAADLAQQLFPLFSGVCHFAVNTRGVAPGVDLRRLPNSKGQVGLASEQQLLEIAHRAPLPCLRCTEYPLLEPPYLSAGFGPVDGEPLLCFKALCRGRVCGASVICCHGRVYLLTQSYHVGSTSCLPRQLVGSLHPFGLGISAG